MKEGRDGGREEETLFFLCFPSPQAFSLLYSDPKSHGSAAHPTTETQGAFPPPLDSPPSSLRQGLHGNGDIPVSSGSTARISSKRAREDGTGGRGGKALFGPGSSVAHPLSPFQCPPARTCKEASGREGARGAYEFCFPHQGDSSLPQACLTLPELPGVTFIPVCRKHVFHGWLH